jgi:hypothetical protein
MDANIRLRAPTTFSDARASAPRRAVRVGGSVPLSDLDYKDDNGNSWSIEDRCWETNIYGEHVCIDDTFVDYEHLKKRWRGASTDYEPEKVIYSSQRDFLKKDIEIFAKEHARFGSGSSDGSGDVSRPPKDKKTTEHAFVQPAYSDDSLADVQRRLISLGYDLGSTGADGKTGAKTSAAIVAFKKAHDLSPANDVVDASFRAALRTATSSTTSSPAAGGGGSTMILLGLAAVVAVAVVVLK